MKHRDNCEIAAGLVITKKYPPNAFNPTEFIPPYDDMLRMLQKDEHTSPEKLIQKFGLAAYQAAESAVAALNGSAKSDWLGMVHESYQKYEMASVMERGAKRLYDGKEMDYADLACKLQSLDEGGSGGMLLSEVTDEFVPYQLCGYSPFDEHLGGMPTVGLTVVGGRSKSGKTTFASELASGFLAFQKKKDVGVFSLEMKDVEYKARAVELGMKKNMMARIHIWDGSMTAQEVYSAAGKEQTQRKLAGRNPLGMIIVDFADLMVIDEQNSEAVMADIYRIMARMAKTLEIPVFLLAQLSRAYQGGLPKPNHLRYSSLCEALSWQILMLYNPNTDWADLEKVPLPRDPGYGYILCWAARGGFRIHGGSGAIRVRWNGGSGWGHKAEGWYPLVKVE
jgi:hypothetical protein